MMEPECIDNPIKEFISLSSKCYCYICKNDIGNNKNKLKIILFIVKGLQILIKINIQTILFLRKLY